jgi:hypothetical protein
MKDKKKTINVQGTAIAIFQGAQSDYISLTDIARYKDATNTDTIIQNWLRNRNTIELLGYWELMYNQNFKPLEFEGFKKHVCLNNQSFKVVEFDHFREQVLISMNYNQHNKLGVSLSGQAIRYNLFVGRKKPTKGISTTILNAKPC